MTWLKAYRRSLQIELWPRCDQHLILKFNLIRGTLCSPKTNLIKLITKFITKHIDLYYILKYAISLVRHGLSLGYWLSCLLISLRKLKWHSPNGFIFHTERNLPWTSNYFKTTHLYPHFLEQRCNNDPSLRHLDTSEGKYILYYFYSMHSYIRGGGLSLYAPPFWMHTRRLFTRARWVWPMVSQKSRKGRYAYAL